MRKPTDREVTDNMRHDGQDPRNDVNGEPQRALYVLFARAEGCWPAPRRDAGRPMGEVTAEILEAQGPRIAQSSMRDRERAEPAVRAHRSFGSSRGQTGGEASGVLTLTDGTVVPIRTVSPRDAPALKRLHGRLGERSIELRFFGPLEELSDEMATYFARAADEDHLALAALEPDGREEIIAVVRYAREAGSERSTRPWSRIAGRGAGWARR